MKFLLHTNKNHFRWLLYLKKKYYNEKRKRQLEQKGYEFINIENFSKLRNLEDFENFSWNKNQTTSQIHTKIMKFYQLHVVSGDLKGKDHILKCKMSH